MLPLTHPRLYQCGLATFAVLAALIPWSARAQITGSGTSPAYTSQSIVNAATQTAEALAPNTLATLYGTNLAFSTRSVLKSDIVRGMMPVTLDGVGVWVNSIQCSLFYISPTQINFVVPYQFTSGTVSVIVARDGQAGPSVNIQLSNTSPGLFLWNGNALAAHLSGAVISPTSPAVPGETIILYAGGLGRTSPDTVSGELATGAFPIYYLSQLQILFNGVPCPPGSILYAGLAPGFAGLYQINLVLPAKLTANPAIQIAVGSQVSPSSIPLSVQPTAMAAN
jgi:uncharacterized protein (TIGR03437 family)